MPIAAAVGISAVAGLGSAFIGSSAAKRAAKTQAQASDNANATTLKMYETTRADLQPWAGTGNAANQSIANMYGLPTAANPAGGQAFGESSLAAFRNSPDYQVAMREGLRSKDLTAAARGNLLSGAQEKARTEYASDLSSMKFGQYMDNLFKISGMGQNAAAGQGSAAMSAGGQISNNIVQAGDASAAGTMGAANAWGGALSGIGSNLGYLAMRNPSAYQPIQATNNGLY